MRFRSYLRIATPRMLRGIHLGLVVPPLAKVLITSRSVELGCSEEILSIVLTMLSVQSVFYRPNEKQAQADSKKAKFHQPPEGDHLTFLAVYNGWKASNFSFSNQWCFENFIQAWGRATCAGPDVRK